MNKKFIVIAGLLMAAIVYGAIATQVTTFAGGNVLTASQLNSEFGNLYSTINNLDDANITAGANIVPEKLDASIAGDGIARNGSTGVLEVNDDNSTLTISSDIIKVKDAGITATQLGTGAVTSAKILDGTIATADIADGNITQAKRAALGQQISSSSGLFNTSSTSATDVTNQSISITTTGRPVYLGIVSDGTDTGTFGATATSSSGGASVAITLFMIRSASPSFTSPTTVCKTYVSTIGSTSGSPISTTVPGSSFNCIDTPAAGTYYYKIQIAVSSNLASGPVASYHYNKFYSYEL